MISSMKPTSVYKVRSDNFHIICADCDAKEGKGVLWCEENGKDFSHGICAMHKAEMLRPVSTSEIHEVNAYLPEHLKTAVAKPSQGNLDL